MSIYGSRQLARYGHMGNALGAFGGIEIFSGGPQFTGSDSYNTFFADPKSNYAQNPAVKAAGYVALSNAIINKAGQVWASIDASANPDDAAWKDMMAAKMAKQISSIEPLAATHDLFGNYPTNITGQLLNAHKQLQASVKAVAAYQLKPQPAPSADPITPTSSRNASSAGTANRNSSDPHWDTTSGGAGAQHGAKDNTLLYVGLAAGAVLLLAGGIFVAKRRSSVAGYRRRSRRSRR